MTKKYSFIIPYNVNILSVIASLVMPADKKKVKFLK